MNIRQFASGQKMVVLTKNERNSTLMKQYMDIRDYHFVFKHKWESQTGLDEFDSQSDVALLCEGNTVIAGCRIIKDSKLGLPIRHLLRSEGLSTQQIPAGSVEFSRFGVNPTCTNARKTLCYLQQFAEGIETYCEQQHIDVAFAVLRDQLARMFSKTGLYVEALEESATDVHGRSLFSTIRFVREKNQFKQQHAA